MFFLVILYSVEVAIVFILSASDCQVLNFSVSFIFCVAYLLVSVLPEMPSPDLVNV
jgi:hypothetical protein